MSRAVLGLGSNLGDRLAHLTDAVRGLAQRRDVDVIAVSRVYETAAVGGPPQGRYLNAVVLTSTTLAPYDLLRVTQSLEQAAGREHGLRWGPRTLDIDLLAYDEQCLDDVALTLPHPLAHVRAFVLVPWSDVEPDAVLPGYGRIGDLAVAAATTEVAPTDLPLGVPAR